MGMNEIAGCNTPLGETLTEGLLRRKRDLENMLDDLNKALKLLEGNPELQALFDIISKVRHF